MENRREIGEKRGEAENDSAERALLYVFAGVVGVVGIFILLLKLGMFR